MATIVTRETGATAKGSPLTNTELDNNFINLNTDKAEKSGTNATGTWPISITGNADTVDNLHSTQLIYGGANNGSNGANATQNVYELPQYKSGFWDVNNGAWAPSTTGWFWGITLAHTSNSSTYNYSGQLVFQNGGGGDNIYARTISAGTPSTWSKLVSSGNYSTIIDYNNILNAPSQLARSFMFMGS